MTDKREFTSIVEALPTTIPFVGPEAIERRIGRTFDARLGANESAFGVSPKAVEAMRREASRVACYNDPENHDLKMALSAHHGIRPVQVVVGAGIDDLLGLAVRMFVAPGQTAVASHGAYATFIYHVDGFGCRLVTRPYRDDVNDLDALLSAARESDARLLYVSNPDNPTGTWREAEDIERLIDALPSTCTLLLDEAYVEFAPASAIPRMTIDPRVIRFRTFSKAHGMAGLRVGYAISDERVAQGFDKVRLHFGVNRVAQVGALASLGDMDFVCDVVERVEAGRKDYDRIGRALGLPTLPSGTNFVTFDAGHRERAEMILASLQEKGVFVRKPGAPPLDRCFRVTVGTAEERAIFEERLTLVVKDL